MLYATHARIHLGNIRDNLRAIRRRVGAAKVLIAVKANAYGHGAVEVARMAEATGGADWLGVATVPEGIELREAGVKLPILKLSNAFAEELDAAIAYDLTLTVADAEGVLAAQQAAERRGRVADVHLKIDTGMRRIGAEPEAAPSLAQAIEASRNLNLQGVFTHLPVSDSPDQHDWTKEQIGRFRAAVEAIEGAIGRRVELVHSANSGGVLDHPEGWGTMVRPGVMVYGTYPDPLTPHTVRLKPGLSLVSRLSFVKPVAAGETVGYGRTWRAERDTVIGTVPIGYGDGYSRLLSNRGRVLIDGVAYPIAGRVCMDQIMVDLGAGSRLAAGAEVVLIGSSGGLEIGVAEVAALMGTITYEVTCLITPRVARVYDEF